MKEADPAAYEYLMGKQSDTRVGFAILGTVATLLALPFLLISALLLMGSFLIVRLAVMLFPAFATLGLFPPARGIVVGIGRVVGAALVNAVVFGVGAAVTVLGLGLILDPDSRLPGWLALVLMPLFSFVMWFALKPFRRLTAMAGPNANPFGEAAESFGKQSRRVGRLAKKAAVMAAASYAGNVAAASTVRSDKEDENQEADDVPERVEARPTPTPTPPVHSIASAAATTGPSGEQVPPALPPVSSTDAPPPPPPPPDLAGRPRRRTPQDRPCRRVVTWGSCPMSPRWTKGSPHDRAKPHHRR